MASWFSFVVTWSQQRPDDVKVACHLERDCFKKAVGSVIVRSKRNAVGDGRGENKEQPNSGAATIITDCVLHERRRHIL